MGGKILALTVLTSMLTTLVVSNAYYKKKQFYPTVVYLLNSNRSLGVLYLQGFLVVWVLCDFLKRLFFGTLRAAEVEVNTLKSRHYFKLYNYDSFSNYGIVIFIP